MTHDQRVKRLLVHMNQAGRNDFHISELREVARLRVKDDHLPIIRAVKDLAPYELWPVYERDGWWTTAPTAEIRQVALFRAAESNATQQQRNYRLMNRFRKGDHLTGVARVASKQAVGIKELFEDDLPAPDRQDSCLRRIDRLMAAEN